MDQDKRSDYPAGGLTVAHPAEGAAEGESQVRSLHFESTIELRGVNPYVLITRDQAALIRPGWKRPLPVLVRIDGKPDEPWPINLMPAGDGGFYLYLNGEVRAASGTKVGDRVAVDVEFDAEYRGGPQAPMPGWFSAALGENAKAARNWEALTPSRKKEILRYFSRLKSEEAVDRNLKAAIGVLSGREGRFLGRSWKDGA
jgi:hypothetical protein